MIKKITSLVIAFAMLFSVTAFSASFTDVTDGTEKAQAIDVLSELGVLSGMGDGSFAPKASLTRAQFAKIAVCMMGKTKEAVVTTAAFSDVSYSDWYSGYVNVVANEGIITGYPDGSFGANDSITYAQTITILVRLLGYSAEDVGHKWPQGYVDKAAVLGITDGVSFSSNDVINRETAALLIYRTLFADMKGTNTALVTKMDANVYEDAVVIATSKQNTALLETQVQTDKGVFTAEAAMDEYLGYEGTLVADENGKVIIFVPEDDLEKSEYTISGVYSSDTSVSVVTEEAGTLVLNVKAPVYMNGEKTVASVLADGVNTGSTITVFKENNTLKHAFVDEYKYEGPKVVYSTGTVGTLFSLADKDSVKVIRKGLSSSLDEIELYDVLYYSARTNTIYAYANRVTGVYEKAYPMKSNVSKVTVSGSTYSLSTQSAVNKLNESEYAFEIGDRVTLLLGENGDVVDAVSLTGTDLSLYGVITKTGTRISEDEDSLGRTEYYVTIMGTDGTVKTYPVKSNAYEEKAGYFCEVDFADSYAVLTFPASTARTGAIDRETKTLGDYSFASDYAIMEYEDGNATSATVKVLSINDVDGTKITKNHIKHVQVNAKGEIAVLYLNDVSGNKNIYGILTTVPEGNSGAFTVLSGNSEYRYSATNNSLSRGDAVAYYSGISGTSVVQMTKVGEGNQITYYNDNIMKMGGKSYTLSDTVTVYAGKYISDLKTITLSDAAKLTGNIVFYSDRAVSNGGQVRVIRIITG